MKIWHLTADATRQPERVVPDERVLIRIGTWPIESAQAVWASYRIEHATGRIDVVARIDARWLENSGPNSYWHVELGPFAKGDRVTYSVHGQSRDGPVTGPTGSFRVGARLYLAILWHQHQPVYKDTTHAQAGSYLQPWVRLHAIRDYYSMAALVAEHPGIHLTINLSPSLIWQIEDYVEHAATDRALILTLTAAERLKTGAREEVLGGFFDADWHQQIFPHARYRDLFEQRKTGRSFTVQDLRDLQMWFNLAWFGKEFRDGDVPLVTGEVASVRRFVEQARAFSVDDIEAMIAEQYKVMRGMLPIHRSLQDSGQIEVSTTPLYHPILPLLINTDDATIDRPGATHPRRFAHAEDADAQVRRAVEMYEAHFHRPPRGMWPAEGAVSQSVIPVFSGHGVRWIATDRGVLARSGRWGYDVSNPDVLCQPYQAPEQEGTVTVFFRDSELSDEIGFHYYRIADARQAATDFLAKVRDRFARRVTGDNRVLTIVLDGENAWGAYRDDARPFLHALYGLLERDREIETVTFAEYLDGNRERGLEAHPVNAHSGVFNLFTGSWIDENGSAPGVDLGTWIGEDEENRAWELLGLARDAIDEREATEQAAPNAFEALYMAEGSDWFWWFGQDQDSGHDEEFDDLFRTHLKNVYRGLALDVPDALDEHIVPHSALWTFTRPVDRIQPTDRLTIRTNCPGELTWQLDDGRRHVSPLAPAGGVMAGVRRHHVTLGPFPVGTREVRFRFRCMHHGCDGQSACCRGADCRVQILPARRLTNGRSLGADLRHH